MGDVYDQTASLYDFASAFIPFERALRQAAVAALGVGQGASVLDLGCGTGLCLPFLASALGPDGRVTGVDASAASLQRAAQKARRRALPFTPLHADAADGGWGGSPFGGALAIFALSVIPRWEQTIARVAASLAPGAAFVVLEQRYATGFPARLFNPVARAMNAVLRADADRDFAAAMTSAGLDTQTESFHGGSYALHCGRI